MVAVMKRLVLAATLGILICAIAAQPQAPPDRTGTISGSLHAKDGSPLAGVRVMAMVIPDPGALDTDSLIYASLAQTDSRGRYRLESVPVGSYYLTAGFVTLPTYYPGVNSKIGARVIDVREGVDLTGMDFVSVAPSSLGGAISGRLVMSSVPAAQSVVLSGFALPAPLQSPIRSDGSFEFPKVPPGTYNITTRLGGMIGASSTIVTVADVDVTGVQFSAPLMIVVYGRVVTADGSPLPDLSGTSVTAQTGNVSLGGGIFGGSFRMHLLEGDNKLGFTRFPVNVQVKSISFAGRELPSGILRIDGPTTGEIQVVIDVKPMSAVSGRIVRGTAINIPAELASRNPKFHLTSSGGPFIETPLKPDGTFQFEKAPPGTYTIDFVSPTSRLSNPPIVVGDKDVTDVKVDLRDNPFPEFPAGSFAAVFESGYRSVQLHGIITQGITQIRPPAPERYFRLDVKDASGTILHWAIVFSGSVGNGNMDSDAAMLKPGMMVTITVNPDRTGIPRGALALSSGQSPLSAIAIDK